LLQIPNYNFDWQLAYEVRNPLPSGTTIEVVAHFDNSRFNPYNPDPDRKVPYGPATHDEMFNAFILWINDDEHLDLKIDPRTGHVVKSQDHPAGQIR
jgi:hypothetical protein